MPMHTRIAQCIGRGGRSGTEGGIRAHSKRDMADALTTGVKYNLSNLSNLSSNLSHCNTTSNLQFVLVKLTDSAYRALEEYSSASSQSSSSRSYNNHQTQDRTNRSLTIQFFNNNEGHLSLPAASSVSGSGSASNNSGNHVYKFSLGATGGATEEGTFDCVRVTSAQPNTLHSLGALSQQMWIQANDDVYETTRHRMAVAEEQHKKNCTRVIKPNTAEIGRKVKVRAGDRPAKGDPPPAPSASTSSVNSWPPCPPSSSSLTSSSTAQQSSYNLYQATQNSNCSNGNSTMRNGFLPIASGRAPTLPTTTTHSRAMSNNHAQKPGNPEIIRRPIKERLIHLLAVRPYKKPELLDRIHRDGIRDREKRMITSALSSVATLKENTYQLTRNMWSEVQEDWPFYTEQDRQMLKRRKPQNLTPPGGNSDSGSSSCGSGQSPSSTHPGSPPHPQKRSAPSYDESLNNGTIHRPGYFETADGLQSKRQRISHYKKPQQIQTPSLNNHELSSSSSSSNQLQQSQQSFSSVSSNQSSNQTAGNSQHSNSPPPAYKSRSESPATVTSSQQWYSSYNSDVGGASSSNTSSSLPGSRTSNGSSLSVTSTPTPSTTTTTPPSTAGKEIQENTVSASEIPEYLTEYTRITDEKQRRRYKDDFNADYDEYKKLHAVVEQVTHKFAELEHQLRRAQPGTPDYKRIKSLIWRAYEDQKRDMKHQEAKRRFHYLHDKLSHIKKLVADYDAIASAAADVSANY